MHTDKRINLINGASNIDLKYEDLIESGVFYNNLLDVILNKIKKEDEDAYDLLDQSLNEDNYGKCIDENGILIIDDKGYKKDISEDYEF